MSDCSCWSLLAVRPDEHTPDCPLHVVDWPARLRAAEHAVGGRAATLGAVLLDTALELEHAPPHVVEAFGRALSGQEP